jgi:hypothetical protein
MQSAILILERPKDAIGAHKHDTKENLWVTKKKQKAAAFFTAKNLGHYVFFFPIVTNVIFCLST